MIMHTTKNIAQKKWDKSFFIFHVLVQQFLVTSMELLKWFICYLTKRCLNIVFLKNIELNLKSKSKFSFFRIILANVFFLQKLIWLQSFEPCHKIDYEGQWILRVLHDTPWGSIIESNLNSHLNLSTNYYHLFSH